MQEIVDHPWLKMNLSALGKRKRAYSENLEITKKFKLTPEQSQTPYEENISKL